MAHYQIKEVRVLAVGGQDVEIANGYCSTLEEFLEHPSAAQRIAYRNSIIEMLQADNALDQV